MSDTAFIHEIQADGLPIVRVTLTLDSKETVALGEVAAAAVDAGVMLASIVDRETAGNAQQILEWANRASIALTILEGGPSASAADDKK